MKITNEQLQAVFTPDPEAVTQMLAPLVQELPRMMERQAVEAALMRQQLFEAITACLNQSALRACCEQMAATLSTLTQMPLSDVAAEVMRDSQRSAGAAFEANSRAIQLPVRTQRGKGNGSR